VPQVPRFQLGGTVTYVDPRGLTASVQSRLFGAQFDDDLNSASRVLPRYSLVNLSASRDLARNLEVFAALQNMFDEQFFVGTLPTLVGPPRLVSAGVRISFQGR
jgi:outer membrane receptor protein involved in Fe transport